MYLMNVPPVAVRQTEWRTCGPPGGYSLQCFNDSDTELSTVGTPISDKVQMIIESLRTTQSSLEMGDEIEENVLPGQDGHPQVCKLAMGSYEGAKSKTKGSSTTQQENVSSPINLESSDSDSDDSVDKGIEEAIAEYLKEKGDHKRKAEPCSTLLHSSKIQRKNTPIPDISKQNSDGNAFLIASYPYLKCVKAETPTVPAAIPIKKYIKNKVSLNDNIKKLAHDKGTMTKISVFPKEQTINSSKTISMANKMKFPVTVKVEEDDSYDSSSDDGIEEAIQRYQLEKQEQQNRTEAFIPCAIKEESDSSTTSDDGIEEAIRHYQLEQLKEKSVLKPFLHKSNPCSRSFTHDVGSTSIESMKKIKLKKKKTRAEKEVKPVPPPSAFIPKNLLSENQKGKGNGVLSFKVDGLKDQPTPAPPKVNTSAELMCAEAILDISKTVMPEAFHQSVELSSCAPAEPSRQSAVPLSCPHEGSDDSSIDSEDGIEQEIRKFLEQKAQMHKQPPSSDVVQEPQSTVEPEKVKAKQVAVQKKLSRMSLTQRRKNMEENRSNSNMSGIHNDVKESAPKYLPGNRKDVSTLAFSSKPGLQKTEQSGDKSSSLDSDEDLDTAIKDLLKTKKKTKKKTREFKRKSKKCLKDEEQLLRNASQTKKLKPDPVFKHSALKKVQKIKDDMQDKTVSSKKNISQHKQTDESKGHGIHEGDTEVLKGTEGQDSMLLQNPQTTLQLKEDSSSVDSDDSIELEIRRFLAEKAKVSTAEKSKDGDVSRNGTAVVCSPPQDDHTKEENQLAEIPRKNMSPSVSGQLLICPPLPTPQSLVPDISIVNSQSHMSLVQTCSPSPLEPADGAGAARTEQKTSSMQRGDTQDVPSQIKRVQPDLSASIAHSCSESIKWRRSLGLPITDTKTLGRQPFLITSSKTNETAPATLPHQSRGIHLNSQTPVAAWSSSRTSGPPFPWSTEKTVNTTHRPPVKNPLSSSGQQPRMSFSRSMPPDHKSPLPIEGETKSMVHISKDKSVFVELESDRTNHVQVRSRERNQGKERGDLIIESKKESESLKIDGKEVHLERKEEELVDEADDESGSGRNPEKTQGFSTLSLSSAIDPGITFRPCIALTSEERSQMFGRRYLPDKCKKGRAPVQAKIPMQRVKRKLQFISTGEMKRKASTAQQK
ncbi:phosphatase 1 regulatory subunit 26 [Solea senegalensis]|uniref:Phosphatase 1 regulatory subunit 26 n=2 Tax=Solea senegalensis TaxID=28829 RepID=A0AAV6R4Z7_SOLSE|nr:protein phosphatase 1 regulatory subunit 26 [Solea senegalensis]KAG7499689.1 phosphatase 1 regulatory subunit 26 [Solea senegalensis]